MALVQRYPKALVYPSLSFHKPEMCFTRVHTTRIRCGVGDDFQVSERIAPAELRLPVQPAGAKPQMGHSDEAGLEVEAENLSFFDEFQMALKNKSTGELALYGGLAGLGLLIGDSLLSSLEVLPLVPEALLAVGMGYSMVIAGRVLKGKNDLLVTASPFKAISELLDSGNSLFQRTTMVMPKDMDNTVAEGLDRLAKGHGRHVNKVEELKSTAADYARVIAEKEALEAVAMEVIKERDAAISEVAELKTIAAQCQRTDQEKGSLEAALSQLATERDSALSELKELKKVVANLRSANMSVSGLTPEQEGFIKERVRAVRSQYIDVAQGYDEQKEEVHRFVSHLVEEYGAPRDWTLNYLKQFLGCSSTRNNIMGTDHHARTGTEADLTAAFHEKERD